MWTQGLSRRRWALTKFAFVGATAVVISVVYGLGLSWWMAPLNITGSRLGFVSFDMQGVVPIGYTLFAVALGVFAGTFLHRVLPAMGATLGIFLAVRVAVAALARPRYQTAQTRMYQEPNSFEVPSGDPGDVPTPALEDGEPYGVGDWLLARDFRDVNGVVIGDEFDDRAVYTWELYHPADRFWPFQVLETGVFVVLALLLFALAAHRIRQIA